MDYIKDDEDTKIFEEAEKMAKNAIMATNIQDQLQRQIKFNEEKKTILEKLHEKKTQKKVEETNKALQEAEFAKLQCKFRK